MNLCDRMTGRDINPHRSIVNLAINLKRKLIVYEFYAEVMETLRILFCFIRDSENGTLILETARQRQNYKNNNDNFKNIVEIFFWIFS